MRSKRAVRQLAVFAATIGLPLLASGCLAQRHLVGDESRDARAPVGDSATVVDGAATSTDGTATGGPDASAPGATVVSLGDKTSLGWALAISAEEVARRLSQMMLQKPPSTALIAAVLAKAPKTNEDVGELADGLLLDENTLTGRQAFYRWWLGLDIFATASRDATLFPAFTSDTRTALVLQTLAFAEDVTWQPAGSLTTLLTQPAAFVTTSTAPWFGGTIAPGGTMPARVMLDESRYVGIATQPAVVATRDHSTGPAPTLRGRDARRRYLCKDIPPPPPGLPVSEIPDGVPVRQWLESSVASVAVCAACHDLIDPLGFAFGHFDAVGAFHETENNAPVDTTGTLKLTSAGASVPFGGAPDLLAEIAKLPEVRRCFAMQWLSFAIGAFKNGVVAPSPGTNKAPGYGPIATDPLPWSNNSPTFAVDTDYIVKRATVQGELSLRGTVRAVTETHSFLDP